MVHSFFFSSRGCLLSLPHPLNRPIRMYYVVDIFRDCELSACCIDIKYTCTLYVEHLIHSAFPNIVLGIFVLYQYDARFFHNDSHVVWTHNPQHRSKSAMFLQS